MRDYPWGPLGEWVEAKGMTLVELGERTGFSRRSVMRWKADGRLTERTADSVAIALGVMPGDIWPTWGEHDEALAEQVEAERRARRAAAMRRYRARNPDYAERQRAAARRYKAECAEYVAEYNRRWRERRRQAS